MKKGSYCSPELREKLSKIRKEYLKNNPHSMLGRKHSKATKLKISESQKGRKAWNKGVYGSMNSNWKCGKIKTCEGYMCILAHNHPNANCNGYILEHRLIMENHIGRYLKREEIVHHINENKSNNRIENLILLTKEEHNKLHNRKRFNYAK